MLVQMRAGGQRGPYIGCFSVIRVLRRRKARTQVRPQHRVLGSCACCRVENLRQAPHAAGLAVDAASLLWSRVVSTSLNKNPACHPEICCRWSALLPTIQMQSSRPCMKSTRSLELFRGPERNVANYSLRHYISPTSSLGRLSVYGLSSEP